MLGVWFSSSIGASALQATLALNFGGEGVVPDRRGLNTSFTYGTNWGVRRAARPSWYCLALWCFHIFWSPKSVVETSLCMLLILYIPNCARHLLFTSKCLLSVSRPIFSKCTKHSVFTGKCNLSVFTGKIHWQRQHVLCTKVALACENRMFCALWTKLRSRE